MVLAARLTDCPAASVYGPMTTDADTNMTEAVTVLGMVTVLASKVTSAFRANALPCSVAPVFMAMDV